VAKKIFIPFTRSNAGQLANRLAFEERFQAGLSQEKKEAGKYRGFKNKFSDNDYVYAMGEEKLKATAAGDTPGLLQGLTAPDDELYINGHCNRGSHVLANSTVTTAKTVSIEAIIEQLKAHRFPTTSEAKVKIWACRAALGEGSRVSFASVFSSEMFKEEYKYCRIFAYTASLLRTYFEGEEGVFHKRANIPRPEEEELRDIIAQIEAGSHVDKSLKPKWTLALGLARKDKDKAIQAILSDKEARVTFLGNYGEGVGVGGRARLFRKEFKDGNIVEHLATG
jgi:hypothetical protein